MAQILGNIEFVSAWVIKGWAAEKSRNGHKQTKLSICLDDNVICDIDDYFYRCDVKDAGIGDGVFGFEADITKHAITTNGKLLSIKDRFGKKLSNEQGGTDVETFALREAYNLKQPSMRSLNLGRTQVTNTDISQATKVAILVTYVNSGKFFSHHHNQIAQLRNAGYYVVVVHVSGNKTKEYQSASAGDIVLRKANIGYDFGSWWYGARWLSQNLPDYHEKLTSLILLNDSCFGLVSENNIAQMENANVDLAGVCDSYDRNYHLQSFFLMARSDFLKSGEFVRWLNAYPFPEQKEDVILAGELGLGGLMKDLSLRSFALAPYSQLVDMWHQNLAKKIDTEIGCYKKLGFKSSYVLDKVEAGFLEYFQRIQRGRIVNPTHLFWQEICDKDISLMKKELLLLNPANVPDYLTLSRYALQNGVINLEDFNHFSANEFSEATPAARHLPSLLQA